MVLLKKLLLLLIFSKTILVIIIIRDGIPKVWDERADGFVRGESVVSLFLQRKSSAKRIYATVLHTKTNIDGNKKMGMFFPSSKTQEDLMIRTYTEAKLDPLRVNYIEAHGTGTEVSLAVLMFL